MRGNNSKTNEIFSIGYSSSKPQIMEIRKVTQKNSSITTYLVVAHMIESELEIFDTTLSSEEIQLIKDIFG